MRAKEADVRKACLAALAALSAAAALAQKTPEPVSQQDRFRAFADAVNRPLVYHVAGEDKVRIAKDRTYRSEPEAKADVYEPAENKAGSRTPIVVFIHGGVPAVPVKPKDWGIYQS